MEKYDQKSWVTKIVEKVTSRWQRGPKVEVVASPWHLPIAEPAADYRGMYTPRSGQVHIVASQPAWTILPTLAHEAIAHHGLRQLLRNRWGRFMEGVHATVESGKDRDIRKVAKRVKKVYTDRRGRCALPPLTLADEVAAAVAGNAADPWSGEMRLRHRARERWANLRRKLHTAKPGQLKLGMRDLVTALRASAQRMTDKCKRVGSAVWSKARGRSPLRLPKWKRLRPR